MGNCERLLHRASSENYLGKYQSSRPRPRSERNAINPSHQSERNSPRVRDNPSETPCVRDHKNLPRRKQNAIVLCRKPLSPGDSSPDPAASSPRRPAPAAAPPPRPPGPRRRRRLRRRPRRRPNPSRGSRTGRTSRPSPPAERGASPAGRGGAPPRPRWGRTPLRPRTPASSLVVAGPASLVVPPDARKISGLRRGAEGDPGAERRGRRGGLASFAALG
mmetsp:Transcript_7645/g.22511  ORF Transcript_7645/g.22511 Transcript_7645/m.22511 type:complete len:219 (+) Transcript_7645:118-774(+)